VRRARGARETEAYLQQYVEAARSELAWVRETAASASPPRLRSRAPFDKSWRESETPQVDFWLRIDGCSRSAHE
jgi:hypothetical protein